MQLIGVHVPSARFGDRVRALCSQSVTSFNRIGSQKRHQRCDSPKIEMCSAMCFCVAGPALQLVPGARVKSNTLHSFGCEKMSIYFPDPDSNLLGSVTKAKCQITYDLWLLGSWDYLADLLITWSFLLIGCSFYLIESELIASFTYLLTHLHFLTITFIHLFKIIYLLTWISLF